MEMLLYEGIASTVVSLGEESTVTITLKYVGPKGEKTVLEGLFYIDIPNLVLTVKEYDELIGYDRMFSYSQADFPIYVVNGSSYSYYIFTDNSFLNADFEFNPEDKKTGSAAVGGIPFSSLTADQQNELKTYYFEYDWDSVSSINYINVLYSGDVSEKLWGEETVPSTVYVAFVEDVMINGESKTVLKSYQNIKVEQQFIPLKILREDNDDYPYLINNFDYIQVKKGYYENGEFSQLEDIDTLANFALNYDVYYGDSENAVGTNGYYEDIAVYKKYAGYVPVKITEQNNPSNVLGEFTVNNYFAGLSVGYNDFELNDENNLVDMEMSNDTFYNAVFTSKYYAIDYNTYESVICEWSDLPLEKYYKQNGDTVTSFNLENYNNFNWSFQCNNKTDSTKYYTDITGSTLTISDVVNSGNINNLEFDIVVTCEYSNSALELTGDDTLYRWFTCK